MKFKLKFEWFDFELDVVRDHIMKLIWNEFVHMVNLTLSKC